MDHKFTADIKAWLDTDPQERDLVKGASLLLQLNGNRILFNNLMADPVGRADFIEAELQRHYDFRVLDLTHQQVMRLEAQADEIADKYQLESKELSADPDNSSSLTSRLLGRRADHDELPDDIKACFRENFSILQRMRELHLRLRSLSLTDNPCPDSERYPFLKDLISLDKKLHANWKKYDMYVIPAKADDAAIAAKADDVAESNRFR